MNKYRLRKATKNNFRDGADLALIAGSESTDLAGHISNLLQTPLSKVEMTQSTVGEYDLCLADSVRSVAKFLTPQRERCVYCSRHCYKTKRQLDGTFNFS
jgi:hypothetical protein